MTVDLDRKQAIYEPPGYVSANGVALPATAVPSTDVNTMDDYKEGVFTPVLSFAVPNDLVVVYGEQVGLFTKIGRMVFISLIIETTTFTHSTATDHLLISGLPYTVGSIGGDLSLIYGGYSKVVDWITAEAIDGDTTIRFYWSLTGAAGATINVGDVPSGTQQYIYIGGHYAT